MSWSVCSAATAGDFLWVNIGSFCCSRLKLDDEEGEEDDNVRPAIMVLVFDYVACAKQTLCKMSACLVDPGVSHGLA